MPANNVRKKVYELLGKESEPLHIQTVKITERAHAKLRALADLTDRSKTALAADLLMAAIDDAIDSLPNEPLKEEGKQLVLGGREKGWLYAVGPNYEGPTGLRDLALESATMYLQIDEHERLKGESAVSSDSGPESVSQNGVHE